MAGAKPGVHVVKLKPVLVSNPLSLGTKFIKWDDDSVNAVQVTLYVDPKGYILYWTDQNKEMDFLDISYIRDTRTGKNARLPKDQRQKEMIGAMNGGGKQESTCSMEDKMLTICYGMDMVNLSFINFVASSKETAQLWTDEIFKCAINLLTLNSSPMKFLEKCHTKLSLILDQNGKIPVRNIAKMFAQHKDDRKRIQKALEQSNLPSGMNDGLSSFSFSQFFSFYYNLCGRQELDSIFSQFGNKQKCHMTAEQFMNFLNGEQRDPRLNEILYPYCDLRKAQLLIEQFESYHQTPLPQPSSSSSSPPGHLSKMGFLCYLLSDENGVIPMEKLDLNEDMTQPLSHYFINSSHNTYLTGHQLTGKSSVEIYRQALLVGCRCIELDCWDGKGIDEEPIITHGFTMCTEISFKEVIEAIAETAFKVSDYPVILSFENHCSPKQQAKIAYHCRNIFGDSLLTDPLDAYPLESGQSLPSPESLKRKILVKNKKRHLHKSKSSGEGKTDGLVVDPGVLSLPSNASPGGSRVEMQKISDDHQIEVAEIGGDVADDAYSDSGSERDETEMMMMGEDEETKIDEIGDDKESERQEAEAGMEMSALVNYIQPARFHSFDYAEKRNRSYECTSFVETQATVLLKAFPVDFVNFNKRQLSRIYPKGTRVDSSNYMPQIFWNAGCHLVALNYQTLDLAMQLNLGTFEYNGRTGYILKPDFMRRKDRQFDPFAESTVDGIVAGTVEIKIIAGQFLTDRKIGTFVEVDMYGLPTDTVRRKFRTKVYPTNGINPVYDEEPFVFRKVVLPNLATLRLAVYHENGTTLIGHRVLPVEGLRPGYRHICLRNECNQPQSVAMLFVHISVKDYIPDAFADFAAALVNPIAYQSSLDKHSQQLAILEEDFDKNDEMDGSLLKNDAIVSLETTAAASVAAAAATTSTAVQVRHPPLTNKKSGETVFAFTRLGSMTNKILAPPENSPMTGLSETMASTGAGSARSLSIPSGSPHHGLSLESTAHKISITSHLLDPDLLETISLSTLKENKQFLKLVSKQNKDFEAVCRKNEKSRSSKLQIVRTELDRIAAAHAKTLATLERSSAVKSGMSNDEQKEKIIVDHQSHMQELSKHHRDDMFLLWSEQLQTEQTHEVNSINMRFMKLEEMLTAKKEAQLAKLKKVYEKEVSELKKKRDAQNWEEMKSLAKRHKEKDELARVRREAMQKYISLGVQEIQKLKDLLARCTADVAALYNSLAEQTAQSKKQSLDQLHLRYEEKRRIATAECHSYVCNGSPSDEDNAGSTSVEDKHNKDKTGAPSADDKTSSPSSRNIGSPTVENKTASPTNIVQSEFPVDQPLSSSTLADSEP